jgi:hypothetical protein
VHDAGMVGPVERDDVTRLRLVGGVELLDRAEQDRLEAQLGAHVVEVVAQGGVVRVVRERDHEHHREVPAQDRHLRILDVRSVGEQHAADGGDDSGPVATDRGQREVAHRRGPYSRPCVDSAPMPLTPEQRRRRDQVETLIRLMAPGLNLVLAAGDRLSRIVAPQDDEYYPVRPGAVEPELPPTSGPADR